MIGDALTDVAAGRAAGVAQAILLRTGRGQAQLQLPQAASLAPLTVYDDLYQAIQTLI
jgi:phosphoglycolate phosphatase-like HAD superfamily hydrolase